MPKINLTNKSFNEQARIIKDYLIRRAQHKEQGEVKTEQLVNRFKHKALVSNKQKIIHFNKILDYINRGKEDEKNSAKHKKKAEN